MTCLVLTLGSTPSASGQASRVGNLPLIKRDATTGFSTAGWKYDRYRDMQPLEAHTGIVVADIEGPAVITHIHITRHWPVDTMARGIVLQIYFDHAEEPAVNCPFSDFFGDGCNGKSMYFSSSMVECAPWSYNAYIPMPFKKHARIILRNDTDQRVSNLTYVEWETLPEWKEDYGYFHATYERRSIQLTGETEETFFHVKGSGHLVGRQFSILTDERLFKNFELVMEGNNEVDIDGRERALDYLGSEDSFTFSWGFQSTFAGPHAGMPYIQKGDTLALSIYRFHDYMPIRFTKELTWRINWQYEFYWESKQEYLKNVARAAELGGCWVDYATVFYWYQDTPGGYSHAPLSNAADRRRVIVKRSDRTAH
jgi:D-arabinan exo alpha-(1,3)/(1,5)-arabinofuranosidase (non-reducing end)